MLHTNEDHQICFVGGPETRKTNPRWRTAAILKNLKNALFPQPYLRKLFIDFDEIWQDNASGTSAPRWPL